MSPGSRIYRGALAAAMTARLAVEAALLSADSRSLGVVGTGAAASLSLVVGGCDGREVMPRSLNEGRPLLYEIWSDAPPCARPFFLEVCGLSWPTCRGGEAAHEIRWERTDRFLCALSPQS